MIKTKYISINTILMVSILSSNTIFGGAKNNFPDKLDHSWSESETSLGDEKTNPKKNKTTSKSAQSLISTQIAPLKELKLLEERLNRVESQIDQLSGEVKKSLDHVVGSFESDGFIKLEMKLRKSTVANLQSVSISINGHKIYKTSDFNGIWIPSDQITVFLGALDPGKHRIDVIGRIVMLNPQEIPDSQSIYRMINRSFTVEIPDTSYRRKLTIAITPPSTSDESVKADLIEGELNRS